LYCKQKNFELWLQIALTSQAITKLTYYFENGSINGFVDYIYSSFQVENFQECSAPNISPDVDPFLNVTVEECAFRGFYEFNKGEYEPTKIFWKDYMVKFVFTLIFNVSQPTHINSPTYSPYLSKRPSTYIFSTQSLPYVQYFPTQFQIAPGNWKKK